MTREEARDQIVIFMCDEQKVINDRDKQALEMAIQALEQSSGDLINRAEAIKAIDEKAKRIKNEDTLNGLAGAVGILFDLPSYNSIKIEPSGDAVSRQAVLEIVEREQFKGDAISEIEKLPSVNPQEPKYCDRNICMANEFNGIGCDECEVTKSQELKTGQEWKVRNDIEYRALCFDSIYDLKNFLNDNDIKPTDIIGIYREHKYQNRGFFDLLYVAKAESEDHE